MAREREREESRGFRYQRRSGEDVQKRANAKGGSFDSIIKAKYKVYKVKDGKNIIRVLPPTWENANHYGFDAWINYGIGVDNQSYLSLSKMKGEKDPIAEARRAAERDGDKELTKQLAPRQRIMMWVIDRNEEDEGPQIFAAPFTVDKALAALSFDEDTKEVIYIDDPKEGCDIRFYKEGTGLKTDYPPEKMRILKPSPLHPDKGQAQEWLDFIQDNPVPDCLQFYDYNHIAMVFDGSGGGKSTDDDDDKPQRSRGNGRAVADDDDDEPPARRSKADDDTQEEDQPRRGRQQADEDDDPPPRRSSRQSIDNDDDDGEKPASSARSSRRNDPEDDAPPPRRGRAQIDEEEDVKPRSSVRDRLRGRTADDED